MTNSSIDSLKSKIDGKKVTDSLGRVITLRQSTIIDRLKVAESLNFKSDDAKMYLNILLYISTVTTGDDVFLIPHPINTVNEFYGIVGKIKDEGFNAVVKFLNENVNFEEGDDAVKK